MASSYINDISKSNNYKIHISAHGVDEIISDYQRGKISSNIEREEFIGGYFSIETQYSFLDKDVIQEFLWLDSELKNKFYKAPLKFYLEQLNYPFDLNKKIGLSS